MKSALKIFPVKKISDVLEKLDLHPAETEKKGKKKKAGIPADPFGNAEAFWGIDEEPHRDQTGGVSKLDRAGIQMTELPECIFGKQVDQTSKIA